MKKIIVILLLNINIISCDKNIQYVNEYKYPSGKIQYRYYYTNNKLDSIDEYFESGKIKIKTRKISANKQHQIIYDESGKNKLEGWAIRKDNKYVREGWWKQIMDKERKNVEYITIGDTTKINQTFTYNAKDEINLEESHYYKINLPDTVEVDKPYRFTVELVSPILGMKGYYRTYLKLSDDISPNFMNYLDAKINYDIKKLNINLWEVVHKFKNKGKFTLRGTIFRTFLDFKNIDDKNIQMIDYADVTYLSKEIYVK